MKKRLVVLCVVLASFLAMASAAFASVDTNLAVSVKAENWNAAKWVIINGTHTASSGYFSAQECTSQWVDTLNNQVTYFAYPMIWNIGTSTYTNSGKTTHIQSVILTGTRC